MEDKPIPMKDKPFIHRSFNHFSIGTQEFDNKPSHILEWSILGGLVVAEFLGFAHIVDVAGDPGADVLKTALMTQTAIASLGALSIAGHTLSQRKK